jgi:tellurite methyltransferase
VRRTISGFVQDEAGDWVARLSCLHRQHVRHRPPFQERPWVLTEAGRAAQVGTPIDCPLCDRAELPDGLRTVRTAGPFDETTIPAGLRRDHLVADGTWGYLRVLEGSVGFVLAGEPPMRVALTAGDVQAIPPLVRHHLVIEGPAVIAVDFLVAEGPD